MTKRINIKDVINEEFYQLPKVFFWNKAYREGLNDGAKLLYMLIRDRFKLSIYTTQEAINNGDEDPAYVDENGDIYCILDNQEIQFTLNTSKTTVKKYMDQLTKLDLVVTETTEGGANRIYLNNPDSSGASLSVFLAEKDYFKHVQARKKKGKEPNKTLEEYIAYHEAKRLPLIHKGVKFLPPREQENDTPRGSENDTPGGQENVAPRDIKSDPLGDQKIAPSNNYSSDFDSNPNDSSESDSNEVIKSSSNDSEKEIKEVKKLEEEVSNNIFTVDDNYALLDSVLSELNLNFDKKGINVIKKTLIESKIDSFFLVDVLNAVGAHQQNVKKYAEKNERIKYEPAFFANNLVDRIIENKNARQTNTAQPKQIPFNTQVRQAPSKDIIFRDWYVN